jgi:hypothetical protein
MMIWPMSGVSGARLLQELKQVHLEAANITSHGSDAQSVVQAYLTWVTDAVRRLRPLISPDELRRLVVTDTYWTTLGMGNPAGAPPLMRALFAEIEARPQDLAAAVSSLAAFLDSWDSIGAALVVPDTNVLLHATEELELFPWHDIVAAEGKGADVVRVVLPLLVVDELDNQKRGKHSTRARRTLRSIYTRFEPDTRATATLQEPTAEHGRVEARLHLDPAAHSRLPRADDELVERCAVLQSLLDQQVHFLTFDTGAALRAAAAGLCTHRLEEAS